MNIRSRDNKAPFKLFSTGKTELSDFLYTYMPQQHISVYNIKIDSIIGKGRLHLKNDTCTDIHRMT